MLVCICNSFKCVRIVSFALGFVDASTPTVFLLPALVLFFEVPRMPPTTANLPPPHQTLWRGEARGLGACTYSPPMLTYSYLPTHIYPPKLTQPHEHTHTNAPDLPPPDQTLWRGEARGLGACTRATSRTKTTMSWTAARRGKTS